MADSRKYSSKLSGKRILVIGGSSGIGYCVAEASIESDASVIISSSNETKIKSSINNLLRTYPSAKDRVSGYPCDLSSPSLESNIEKLLSQCGGKLDHIVITAGDRLATSKIEDITLESIQKAAMVRFNAPLLLAKHVRKYLNAGPAASITLTTGTVSQKPMKDWSSIASYAAGLHGMTRNLALDLAPIRVNLISPGAVLTPLWDGMPEDQFHGFVKMMKEKLPTGEIGRPEDVAESYLYVMRDWNCTGSVISTNGGALLT
ncbi:hypothetical protein N7G274_003575 [Stereocaulon virgatum]|uniref:NAD(P)-binding protein n=1 Tax=Stereocaulon virgatum TaxID=373712 RepID=A0ABR4ADZ5_9LECA